MTEIFLIFLQFLILHLFFSTPLNIENYKNLNFNFSFNYFDIIFFNIVIHLFILLILSFLKINLLAYFTLILIISLITNFNLLIKKKIKDINIYIIIFPIICYSIFFEIAHHAILDWDGLAHWFWKVNNFYQNENLENIINLPLPQYPHLGSYIWSFFWKNSLSNIEYIGRLFIPYIYVVSLFTISADIKNKLYGILFLILLVTISFDLFLFSGYQEYITFAYICFLTKIAFFKKKNFSDKIFINTFIIIGSFSLLWIKQECLFYVIFFNLCFVFFVINKKLEKFYYFIALIFIIILYFFIEKNIKGSIEYQTKINLSNLEKFKELNLIIIYISQITKHVLIAFFKYPILICNLIILSISFFKDQNRNNYKFLLLFFSLNLFFLYTIYFLHPASLDEMLPNTVDRILFQISSSGIIFMGKWVNKTSA